MSRIGTAEWVRPTSPSGSGGPVVQMSMDGSVAAPDSTATVITFAAPGAPTLPRPQYDTHSLRSTTDLTPDGATLVTAGNAVVMTAELAGYWEFSFMFEIEAATAGAEDDLSSLARQVFLGIDDTFIDQSYEQTGVALEATASPRSGMDIYAQGSIGLPTIGANIADGQVIWLYTVCSSVPDATGGNVLKGFVRMRRISDALVEAS